MPTKLPLCLESPSLRCGFHKSPGFSSEPWGCLPVVVGSAYPSYTPRLALCLAQGRASVIIWTVVLLRLCPDSNVGFEQDSALSVLCHQQTCLQGSVYSGCKPWASQLQSLGTTRSEVGNGLGTVPSHRAGVREVLRRICLGQDHPPGVAYQSGASVGWELWAQCSQGPRFSFTPDSTGLAPSLSTNQRISTLAAPTFLSTIKTRNLKN